MEETEHLDPTAEIQVETVKKKAVRGVLTLTGRTIILNILAFVAQGFLWAFLEPAEFGTFWVVSAVVNFLVYFSDIGLAASLIQKKEEPTEEDLKTTFTVQQTLVILLLVTLFVGTPFVRRFYALSDEAVLLMYSLGVSLLMSSLKSIPSVILERKLEFGKLVLPQIAENFVYNISVVFFAWKGLGVTSFTYSVWLRGIVGLVLIYILQPWKPGFAFSLSSIKGLLKFGVPYQVNTFLAVLKDEGMTVILGSILGPAGMGILGTARRLAQYPLRFFMDNVTKVTFPAFARMQGEKEHLERSVTRSIFFITFFVFPSVVGLVLLSPMLVKVIPRYEKWTPALIPLAIFAIDTVFASVSTQLTNLLTAIGKIKITFGLMVMWTVLTFASVPALSYKFGLTGAALGYAFVGVSSIIAIIVAKRQVNFSLTQSVLRTGFGATVMGVTLLILRGMLPENFYSIWILIVTGGAVYLTSVFLLVGYQLIEDVKKGISAILPGR